MVVPGGVEGESSEEFAGGGVDDADVAIVDEEKDGGSGVGSSDADVVESAVVAEGDDAAGVDAVVSDALACVIGGGSWCGFGESLVGDAWCDAVEGSVWALVVVGVDERVELVLESDGGVGGVEGVEVAFEGLLEAFDAPMFVKPPFVVVGWRSLVMLCRGGSCRSLVRCSA